MQVAIALLIVLLALVAILLATALLLNSRMVVIRFAEVGGSMISNLPMDNDAVKRIKWTPESKGGNPVPLADLTPAAVISADPTIVTAAFDAADPTVIVVTGQTLDGSTTITVTASNVADQTPVSGQLVVVTHDPDATQIVFDDVTDVPAPAAVAAVASPPTV